MRCVLFIQRNISRITHPHDSTWHLLKFHGSRLCPECPLPSPVFFVKLNKFSHCLEGESFTTSPSTTVLFCLWIRNVEKGFPRKEEKWFTLIVRNGEKRMATGNPLSDSTPFPKGHATSLYFNCSLLFFAKFGLHCSYEKSVCVS